MSGYEAKWNLQQNTMAPVQCVKEPGLGSIVHSGGHRLPDRQNTHTHKTTTIPLAVHAEG